MKPVILFSVLVLPLILAGPAARAAQPAPAASPAAAADMEWGLGGVGGVYFLASPGELTVDVQKRDRNIRGVRAELRAILFAPDRNVVAEATIPDDGQPRGSGLGPLQQARLSTRVPRKGVYGLNITVSQDRYGEEAVWGFRTNCPRYLIETSRGHRDARHEEPIVLLNPGRPGDVCFLPRESAFELSATDLAAPGETLSVYDAQGTLIQSLAADSQRRLRHAFPAAARKNIPWRLHLPQQQGTIHIDGVTRWEEDDEYVNLSCWTTSPAAYFPLLPYRWLLTPYSRTVYGQPGQQGEIRLRVHNNSRRRVTVGLEVEFPDAAWPAELSARSVSLDARQATEVALRYTVPGHRETCVCHVRATPAEDPEFTTYSTITVKTGAAPASRPIPLPLVLRPYRHENEQFGYLPNYPLENQVYFDLRNRPYVSTSLGLATLRDGQWATPSGGDPRRAPRPTARRDGPPLSSKIAFDAENNIYVVSSSRGRATLLHSSDGGRTFASYVLPGSEGRGSTVDIEQFSGHNVPQGPPPLVRFTQTAADPQRIWRRINDLELIVPQKSEGRLVMGEPVLVSRNCIGYSGHSGTPSSVVSRGNKVHVVWAEATDPKIKVPGVPTYVVTYDRSTAKLGDPVLVGYGAPPNDVHNTPSITMDSQGYLHVLAGTHGSPFQYARSLKPNDAHAGWTPAEPLDDHRQTYIGLVCGPDDTLHLTYRLWRSAAEPFPASQHAVLAYQRKRPGEPWEAPRELVVPPFSEYSVYYHRLTIDRQGRLFLSYDYWSTFWFYRTDHAGSRRALLMSPDGGNSWKLVETRDFR